MIFSRYENMPKRGKTPIKKWGFRGEKRVLRAEKMTN